MSFFSNLFGKAKPKVKVRDLVLSSTDEKLNKLCHLESEKKIIILVWFEVTKSQIQEYFLHHNCPHEVLLTSEYRHSENTAQTIFFAEHYPLFKTEQEYFERIQIHEAVVYCALDEELFKRFGGDRLISMMEKLGMQKDEIIEHKLVSSSITNAQQKIEKKIDYEQKCRSQQAWFQKNLPKLQ